MNFYPHHIGDYISHTAHLSNDEDLAYRRLIELYYQTEGPLALDVQSAARAIRMRDQKDAVEAVLSEFFVATDEGYQHGRCDDEIAKYHCQIEAGKRGAAKRWGKGKDREPIGTPLTPQCDPNSNQNQNQNQNHINPRQVKSRGATASRLPADWAPTDADIAYCKTERPDLNIARTVNSFRDYWHAKAGAGARKVDWAATWRSWVRNDKSFSQPAGRQTQRPRSTRKYRPEPPSVACSNQSQPL